MTSAAGVNGQVVFENGTITITRRGLVARASLGKGTKQIPVQQVAAVQIKPAGMSRGFIRFTVPGGLEQRSRVGSRSTQAARDENSILFTRKQQPAFERVAAEINAALTSPQAVTALSAADEIGKLAALRADGHLTDSEFETQKARLLQ